MTYSEPRERLGRHGPQLLKRFANRRSPTGTRGAGAFRDLSSKIPKAEYDVAAEVQHTVAALTPRRSCRKLPSSPGKKSLQITLLAIIGLAIVSSWVVGGETQAVSDLKSLYEKHEVTIPMRDGVKLFTAVYSPRDTSQRYPILLTRTAYGIAPYGSNTYRTVIGPSEHFAREGYIVAIRTFAGGSNRRVSSFITSRTRKGRRRRMRARTPTTPSSGSFGTSPITMAASASGAFRGAGGKCQWE